MGSTVYLLFVPYENWAEQAVATLDREAIPHVFEQLVAGFPDHYDRVAGRNALSEILEQTDANLCAQPQPIQIGNGWVRIYVVALEMRVRKMAGEG